MQLLELHPEIDDLQLKHGSPKLSAIYGAGSTKKPEVMLMFMNPTAKNVSAHKGWSGLRAPWIGTKNIWKILFEFGFLSNKLFEATQNILPHEWSIDFAQTLYEDIANKKLYITNLAKCTQEDARHVPDSVFREYVENTKKEILLCKPKKIITFGNQVSSTLLGKPITVSKYANGDKETLDIGAASFNVYPTYYPVGQGRRNLPSARKRIAAIIAHI